MTGPSTNQQSKAVVGRAGYADSIMFESIRDFLPSRINSSQDGRRTGDPE